MNEQIEVKADCDAFLCGPAFPKKRFSPTMNPVDGPNIFYDGRNWVCERRKCSLRLIGLGKMDSFYSTCRLAQAAAKSRYMAPQQTQALSPYTHLLTCLCQCI